MNTDLLHKAGEALYGPRWQMTLAEAVGVSGRTMRRWASGKWPVPHDAWKRIHSLLRDRRRAVDEISERVRAVAEGS